MINGDKKNNILKLILYFPLCIYRQQKGTFCNSLTVLSPTLSFENLQNVGESPPRFLCNAFWNSIDYAHLEKNFGKKLNFFDLGCGSGQYGLFLKKLSETSFGSYVGLDVYKDKNFPREFEHHISRAEDCLKFLNKETNFIISQSSLEHIEGDTEVLSNITGYLCNTGAPFIQVHTVPASLSLWLFLWHGWRQYSLKNLSGIAQKLKSKSNVEVHAVPLGGKLSFWTHFRYITLYNIKVALRPKLNSSWCAQPGVDKKIFHAVLSDKNCTQLKRPIFWALIILSKHNKIKFKD